ncbi:MAG: hypothetical protein VYB65_05885 [Myxococcota bacterium]|nr:hypothetical protein [Myxococcota bacterium]
MTLSELAQHLTREEMAAFGMWPHPLEHEDTTDDEREHSEPIY